MTGADAPRRWLGDRVSALRGDGRGWIVLTISLGWFVTLGLRFVVPALLPRIKDGFGVDNAAAGLAVTVIWLTYAGTQLPAGALVDRLGERRLLTASLLLAACSLALFAFLPTYGSFLAVAALFGLGTGLFGPPRGTVLSRTFADNDGTAFGTVLAAGSVGAAALPVAAIFVSTQAGWRIGVAAFAPLFVALAVATWLVVPSRHAVRTDGEDPTRSDSTRVESLRAVASAAASRHVVVAVAGAMVMLFTFQGLTAFYTTYLIEHKQLSPAVAGGLFAVMFLAGAVFQTIAGRLADSYGHRLVLVAIAALSVPPLAAMPYVDNSLLLGLLTVPIGIRLAMGPVVNAYIVRTLPRAVRGTTWGLVRTVFFTVGSTGSIAVGVMADAELFDAAIVGLAALTLPAVAIFLLLPDREAGAAG
jgi:predicted MFS family arabinose efflux permease